MGKQADTSQDRGWGTVQIVIYPAGTEILPSKAGTVERFTRNNLRSISSGASTAAVTPTQK